MIMADTTLDLDHELRLLIEELPQRYTWRSETVAEPQPFSDLSLVPSLLATLDGSSNTFVTIDCLLTGRSAQVLSDGSVCVVEVSGPDFTMHTVARGSEGAGRVALTGSAADRVRWALADECFDSSAAARIMTHYLNRGGLDGCILRPLRFHSYRTN